MNMQKFKETIVGEEQASIRLLELLDSAKIKETIQELTQQKSNDILSEMSEVAEDSELDVETSDVKIVGLNPDQEDGIHSNILARQKEEIAQKKYKDL